MKRPRTHYTKVGDIHIAYQVFGEGPIDLLWAQGWATHIEYAWESPDYARFLTKLGRFARVIFFDKRGVGMSDRDVGYPTLEERAQDVTAVLDAVGSDRVAVFGASEGGALSCVFAATHPERVSHLILHGSRPCYRWAPDYPWGLRSEEVEREIAEFSDFEDFAVGADGAPSIAGDPAALEWLNSYFRYAASPRSLQKLTVMNYDIDYRGVLSSIQAPTLILHREGDRWCGSEHGRYIAEHIPGATFRLLPGEDHIVWYGDQESIIREISGFVTGTAVARPGARALLTLLFVDIVNSTGHLTRMGDDRWRGVLEQLDHVVGRRIAALGGTRIKATGDGYLISFRGPTSALECAMALREDMARLGLEGRFGLHAGECEVTPGDVSGLAVHAAARIMDSAGPGEILLSQTARDLALGAPVVFSDRGEVELRGLSGRWRLHCVAG